ncbi:MAG: purine-nucleoside phosphorylase [Arachnia sp.]
MPTLHINADIDQIAPAVLMPGDPKRAERIATELMADARLVTDIRGMLGFTGSVDGRRLTVMGSGMGMPSATLYATELFEHFGVTRIIRVGTCGGIAEKVGVGDAIIATGAHTDSGINQTRLPGINFAAVASFELAAAAMAVAGSHTHTGTVLSSDHFYLPRLASVDQLASYGVLAVEMEAAGLFATAAQFGRQALAVLTVSDHLRSGHADMSAADREAKFAASVRLALAAAFA